MTEPLTDEQRHAAIIATNTTDPLTKKVAAEVRLSDQFVRDVRFDSIVDEVAQTLTLRLTALIEDERRTIADDEAADAVAAMRALDAEAPPGFRAVAHVHDPPEDGKRFTVALVPEHEAPSG